MATDFPHGADWLARNWDELTPYAFQWVAATGDGLVEHAEALDAVLDAVERSGLTDDAVYAYVDITVEEPEQS
jgi:hypothetical protein